MDEAAFKRDVAQAVALFEQFKGHYAARTKNMIVELGEVDALSKLVQDPDLQDGFKVLRDNNMLDKTFEAVVVKYPHMFDEHAVQAAQWRLDNPGNLLKRLRK